MRMRFYMTWNVKHLVGIEGLPFSSLDHFYALARLYLVKSFPRFSPEISITVRSKRDETAVLDITWDIDLDRTPGPWHMPDTFEAWAFRHLCEDICGYGTGLSIEVFRHADFREAVDHDEIIALATEDGRRPSKEDFPVFRPEKHPDWPDANEVFKLAGAWFWCAIDDPADPTARRVPAAGPDPVRIFAAWKPSERYISFPEDSTASVLVDDSDTPTILQEKFSQEETE